MTHNSLKFVLLAVLFALAAPLQSAVVIARSDEAMLRAASAVITGTVAEVYPRLNDRGDIETVARIVVDEAIKGGIAAGDIVDVVQFGGSMNGRFQAQSGAPRYDAGARYFVVLDRDGRGQWTTFDLALGQFRFVDRGGKELLVRDTHDIGGWMENGELFQDHDRSAAEFLAFARGVAKTVAGPRIAPDAFRAVPLVLDFDLKGTSQTAVNTWHGGAAAMNDTVIATPASGDVKDLSDGESRVIADDPHGDVSGSCCPGVVATAFFGCGPCNNATFNGETYTGINAADVVVNDGVSSATLSAGNFLSAMVHEFGHTFGFRHSNQNASNGACASPLPCSSSAIMNSSIIGGLNGTLQSWDLDAANEVYGDGSRQSTFTGTQYVFTLGNPARRPSPMTWRISQAACTAPSISTQPQNQTINSGQQANLSVVAAGTGPFTYLWYTGTPPSGPVAPGPNNTGSTYNPSPSATTTYWVRVTNSCGTIDSAVATVTVNAAGCTPASINTQPQNQTITSGQQASLSVVAGGTAPFTYLWHTGTPPGGPAAPGTNNGSTYNPAPTSTTTYWVTVTNSCGSIDSAVATVTVNPATGCTPPSITTQPNGSTITAGQFAGLSVGAAGTSPFTFQWFIGQPGDTSTQVGTGQNINVSPSQTTSYWVRVTGQCSPPADSRSVVVTVNAAVCVPPSVVNDPPDQTITAGTAATLFVGYTGSTSTVTWFRGVQGDTSTPIGNGQSVSTGTLTSNAQFWAQLVNSCGTAKSRTVTISVVSACVAPAITSVAITPATIAPGGTVTLTVGATGTGLQYQWYRGTSPDTSNPVPNGNTAVATDTPAATTSYFVRVSNSCGTKDSDPVRVTVSNACLPPTVTAITDDPTISSNTTVTLVVTAAGDVALHYQWFRGSAGDTTSPVGTDSASFTSSALFTDAKFWVKVTNACAPPANSKTVNVTVIPARHRATRK